MVSLVIQIIFFKIQIYLIIYTDFVLDHSGRSALCAGGHMKMEST